MKVQYLQPTKLFDGQSFKTEVCLKLIDDRIAEVLPSDQVDAQVQPIDGIIAPGYIDVQVNGGGGALLNSKTTTEGIATIAKAHSMFGTTGILPTLITDDVEVMERAADAMRNALTQKVPGVLGIHFEGPHLSVAKKGVHSTDYIRPLTEREKAIFKRKDIGTVMVTLAPENVPPADIRELADAGVLVCLGHSNADSETVKAALAAGATGFTHLFNAMSAFQSREPGMVGIALLDETSWCGLIVDGHHVHYDTCKLAIKAKTQGKIMLVTDAMSPVGTDDDSFAFFGSVVHRTGDRLNAVTGELAGSCIDMAKTVQNTVEHVGCALDEALKMASRYPAEFLGKQDLGRVAPGSIASFVVLDDALNVTQTWIDGKQVF